MKYENLRKNDGGVIILHSDENVEIGRCNYTIIPDESKLIISYVLVHRAFEGRGMGKYLVEAAIGFARENNWKVYPRCSYASSVMKRMSGVEDILLHHP